MYMYFLRRLNMIAGFLICCLNLVHASEFKKITELVELSSQYLHADLAESTIDCGRRCSSQVLCRLFMYDTQNKNCQTYTTNLSSLPSPSSVQSGSSHTYFLFGRTCEEMGFIFFNESNTCYKPLFTYFSHDNAVAYCEQIGSYLVRINSADEQNLLLAYMQTLGITGNAPSGIPNQWIHIDGSDVNTEDSWFFSDGSDVNYTNFYETEPNPLYKDGEDCLIMMMNVNGDWNDYPCDSELYFVCESDPVIYI